MSTDGRQLRRRHARARSPRVAPMLAPFPGAALTAGMTAAGWRFAARARKAINVPGLAGLAEAQTVGRAPEREL